MRAKWRNESSFNIEIALAKRTVETTSQLWRKRASRAADRRRKLLCTRDGGREKTKRNQISPNDAIANATSRQWHFNKIG